MRDGVSSRSSPPNSELGQAATILGARIREVRHSRGLTLVEVASQAELSHSFLSQVERGRERLSMASLYRVAQALGTTQQALLTEEAGDRSREQGTFHVFRKDADTPVDSGEFPLRVMARGRPRFVPMVMEGEFVVGPWWIHDEEEFVYVLDGTLVVVLDDQEVLLSIGDAVYYGGGIRHQWRTEAGATARVLVVKEGSHHAL